MKHAIRLITSTGIILLLLLSLMPVIAFAAPGDTTVGALSLTPAFEHISVISSFSGDDNGNNQAILEYRQTGTSEWKPGILMTVDRRDNLTSLQIGTIPNPYKNQWRAIIFDLIPNTSYDVKVTYSDPDGGSGTVQDTITTRNDDPPSTGNVYYVATSGNDTSGDGSIGNPWQTIAKAANSVAPGDTVRIMPGTYNEQIILSTSGNATNYITFRSNDPNDKAVVVSSDSPQRGTFRLINISYIRFKELDIATTSNEGSCVFISGSNSYGNIVEDSSLSSVGTSWWAGGVIVAYEATNTLIQRNQISTTADGNNGPFGVLLISTGGGTVIRDNTITGGFYDGIGGAENSQIDGGPYQNSYIYRNIVNGTNDDGIEIEGGGINVAIWGNTIKNTYTMALGIAPVIVGPMYIFRNVIDGSGGSGQAAVKMGSSSYGFIYFYHNTIYNYRNAGPATYGYNSYAYNIIFRNNIIQVSGGSQYNVEEFGAGDIDFDYNSMYSTRTTSIKWLGTVMSWADWRANYGQEPNGIWGQAKFSNPAGGDFSLQSDSPGINAGIVLPGFNDANSPWPYNGSAPDIGAFEYGIVESVPPYTSGLNPTGGATDVYPNTNIIVHVQDDDAGVDQSTIVMTVEGATVTPTITGSPSDYTLTYDPPVDFSSGQVVDVTIDAEDSAATPNLMQDSYSFTIMADAGNPPVLNPIGNKTIAEGELLTFTVNATDSDGPSPLAYSASSIPSGASFDTGTHVFSWTPSYTQAGSYTDVHFEVTDGWNSAYENITITVTNTNRQPQANAGPDQAVVTSTLVTLDGSGSSDPDGDTINSYAWTQTSGPSAALADNTTATPTFTPVEAGTYMFSLVVNDGTLDSNPDSVTITVSQWLYLPVRVNAGGADYTDGSANTWQADQSYDGSWGFVGGSVVDRGTGLAISGTSEDRIYQTERYGLSNYQFDVGNGTYDVTLHFAETFSSITGTGQRVFDVSIEGQLVLDNLDIYSEVGSDTALIKTINNVSVTDGQLTIDFTPVVENPEINGIEIFAANASTPPPSSDGGGGGGGGGGGAGITPVIEYVTGDGRFLDDVEAKSDDGKAVLYIPEDTIGQNSAGYMLASITIKVWGDYPGPPKYYKIIPPVYHMTPVGATFDPSIDLTISYDNSLVPELLAEKNLVVATCDTRSNEWEILDSIVDPENDTIKTKVSHFSFFAVMAPIHPASFEITEFYVTPEQADFGETVSIGAVITNTGDLTGSHELSIKLDGEIVEISEITLDGGDSQTVSFNVNPETTGVHEVGIGELSATFTVQEPKAAAAFSISELTITAAEVNLGEIVEISVLVTNAGDLSGSYDVILKMDDTIMQSKKVTLDGGDDTTISFIVTPESIGEHLVNIGDLLAVLEVKEPPPTEESPTPTAVSPEITNFIVTPIYDNETGKLVSANIYYQINGAEELTSESELILKVFYEGAPLEEIPLLSVNQLQSNESIGIQGYVPSLGWRIGLYTLHAELADGKDSVQSTEREQFTVTPESITQAVSWRTLGIIIGSVVVLMVITVALILYRRRNMLLDYTE